MASTQGNSATSAIRKWKPLTTSLRHAHFQGNLVLRSPKAGPSVTVGCADDVELVAATAFLGQQRTTARS